MAQIVLGMASSHGPQLNMPPEDWGARAKADHKNPRLFYAGSEYDFDGLKAERGTAEFEPQLGEDVWRERHRACMDAIEQLAKVFAEVRPDVAVIFSADHKEIFGTDNLPGLLVYAGEEVDHVPFTEEQLAAMPPGLAQAEIHNVPETPLKRPCAPDLATHLIRAIREDGFETAVSSHLPAGRRENHSIPHGWGFVYRHIMQDEVIPNVPFFLNTFYPPNQPTAWRCYDLGVSLRRAIEAWPTDTTVALIASGGLSHFVIEEHFDRHVLQALESGDADALRALPTERLQSGTSEIRNWVAVAGSMAGTGLDMHLLNYVPCYRSEAGTGCAMGFAHWSAR